MYNVREDLASKSKILSFESQDITLIDTDKERLTYAENQLDIKTLKVMSCIVKVMRLWTTEVLGIGVVVKTIAPGVVQIPPIEVTLRQLLFHSVQKE